MEPIIKDFIGKSESLLTNEHRKLLLFLYEELQIEVVCEEDQTNFIECFTNEDTLRNMVPFKSSLQEIIREIEANIPEIELEKHERNRKEQKYDNPCELYGKKQNELKKQAIIKGNIIYIPFNQ